MLQCRIRLSFFFLWLLASWRPWRNQLRRVEHSLPLECEGKGGRYDTTSSFLSRPLPHAPSPTRLPPFDSAPLGGQDSVGFEIQDIKNP